MTTQNEFFNALRNIQSRATRIPLPDVLVLKAWEHLADTVTQADHAVEIEQRADDAQTYLVPYPNQVANPDFDTALTSWTEATDAGITGTTAWTGEYGEVFAQQGAIGGCEMEITASTGAGVKGRRQSGLTAAASEVWNLQLWVKGDNYSTAEMKLTLVWRPSGTSVTATSTDTSGDFVELKIENQTAPGGTTSVDFYADLRATGAGGTGKVFIAKARAERASGSTITARARRIIAGEWLCRS